MLKNFNPLKTFLILVCALAIIDIIDFILTSLDPDPIKPIHLATLSLINLVILGVGGFRCYLDLQAEKKYLDYYKYRNAQTHLPNRIFFIEKLEVLLPEISDQDKQLAISVLSINQFDEFSYTLSHTVADKILREVYYRLNTQLSESNQEYCAQLLHDGLIFCVPIESEDELSIRISDLLAQLKQPVLINQINVDIDLHIGTAIYPTHQIQIEALIQDADFARILSQKKLITWMIYNPKLDHRDIQRLSLMGELISAIESKITPPDPNSALKLFFQPKIACATDSLTQVEVLIRWIHPKRGFIPPDDFIPLAEQTGVVNFLTPWVLKYALQAAVYWRDSLGYQIDIAINFSTKDLLQSEFIQEIPGYLQAAGWPAKNLIIEITEGAVMHDPKTVLKALHRIREMGIQLSVDDFGAGYSSLEYLKKLPIHELKIDKGFVLNMATDLKDQKIVASTIQLAQNLGLTMVAEGVENQATYDLLKSYGCNKAQGYFISKPLSFEEFQVWLQETHWGLCKI